MKRLLSVFLSLVLAFGLLPVALVGCSSGDVIRRPSTEQVFSDEERYVIPKAATSVNKTLSYIDLDDASNNDLFMAVSLQGNVNRETASIYVIHDEMIEGVNNVNVSKYWFDKLDEQYTGDAAFTKKEYTDPYQMVKDFAGKIEGAVLYHERLVDAVNTSRDGYSSRYADMAVLNLTIMMAAKFNSVALTYEQYNKLQADYDLTLPIKGDTTCFMETNEDGSIAESRGSREVWAKVYTYALDEFKDFSREGLGHMAGNQAATFDFFIANDIFIYNRIFTSDATEKERAIEDAILTVSKPNTPVFGCWYLQADEGALVPYLTENYKFFIVNYESFNWSWTTALPQEEFSPGKEEEKLTLDETKNYVAFTFTEGDNNSYVHGRMAQMFDNDPRTENDDYPIGWTIAPTVWETNPNIIKYYRDNWREGDSLAIPESGVDYVYHCPPEETQQEYFHISDQYLGRVGSGVVRMLDPDTVDPLPFAQYMDNLEGMFLGYYETKNSYYNSELANFMFRGKPFFTNYSGADVMSLNNSESQGPGFYAVTLLGWNQDAGTVKMAMDQLGDNFVCVTPSQLVDLYKQKHDKEFNEITAASFDAYMTREEMGYLWESSNYASFDSISKCRVAEKEDYFTYRFNFDDEVKKATMKTMLSGEYQIEASTDYLNWTVLGKGNANGQKQVEFDLSNFVKKNETVYVRFGDPTPSDGRGANVYKIAVGTDKASAESFTLDAFDESNFLLSGGKNDGSGRSGEFTYAVDFKNVKSGDLAILGGSADMTLQVSSDNKTFSPITLTKQGKSRYAKLKDLKGKTYLKFKTSVPITKIKFTEAAAPIKQFNLSPVSNNLTKTTLISGEETKTVEASFNSNRQVTGDNSMIYRFTMAEGVNTVNLNLSIMGLYKIEISRDNVTYTTLKSVAAGEDAGSTFKADISAYCEENKDVYLKVSMSEQLAGKTVKLAKIRIFTNLTEEWLYEKVDSERPYDALIAVESGGREGDFGINVEDSAEYKLLDQALTSGERIWMHNYAIPRRMLSDSKQDAIVYKFDLASDSFWEILGLDKIETVTRFKMRIYALNGFNVSASNDGENWTELYDTNDVNAANGANAKEYDFLLNPYVGEGKTTVYLRFKLSNVHADGKTHPGQWENLQFFFN